jgi:hypothetical protein
VFGRLQIFWFEAYFTEQPFDFVDVGLKFDFFEANLFET